MIDPKAAIDLSTCPEEEGGGETVRSEGSWPDRDGKPPEEGWQ